MHQRKIDIFITYISIAYWCHSNNSKRLLQIRSLTTQMSFSVQTEVLESYKYQNREELKEHQARTNISRVIICLPVCLCGLDVKQIYPNRETMKKFYSRIHHGSLKKKPNFHVLHATVNTSQHPILKCTTFIEGKPK